MEATCGDFHLWTLDARTGPKDLSLEFSNLFGGHRVVRIGFRNSSIESRALYFPPACTRETQQRPDRVWELLVVVSSERTLYCTEQLGPNASCEMTVFWI